MMDASSDVDAMLVDSPAVQNGTASRHAGADDVEMKEAAATVLAGSSTANSSTAAGPAPRVQQARYVLLNKRALTPLQKAAYEQTSELLSPVENREEVVALVEGTVSEGWIKINGLTEDSHVYIKRRLNRDERHIAKGYPRFDPKDHLAHIPKRFRPPIDSATDIEYLDEAPRKAKFRHATKKRLRADSTSLRSTSTAPSRGMSRRVKAPVKYTESSLVEDEAGEFGSKKDASKGKGKGKMPVDEDYQMDEESVEEDDAEASEENISEASGSVVRMRKRPRRGLRRSARLSASVSISDSEDPLESMEETRPPKSKMSTKRRGKQRQIALSSEEDELEEKEEAESDVEALQRHRERCDKCLALPAHKLLATQRRKRRKGRRKVDALEETEEEFIERLGGWLTCTKCCSAYHWQCISGVKRTALLKADRDRPEEYRLLPDDKLYIDERMAFVCANCDDPVAGPCFVCEKRAMPDDQDGQAVKNALSGEAQGGEADQVAGKANLDPADPQASSRKPLLFRCTRCHRGCHYEHLAKPDSLDGDATLDAVAAHYQQEDYEERWTCHDCKRWKYDVEHILAWRPTPAGAVEPARGPDDLPDHRGRLPREYLIKWKTRSFRHISWVSHTWLLTMELTRLGRFLREGSSISFKTEAAFADDLDGERTTADEVFENADNAGTPLNLQPKAEPDAEAKIPPAWMTIDRVLDVQFVVDSEEAVADSSSVDREHGELGPDVELIGIDDWEKEHQQKLLPEDAENVAPRVAWIYAKWLDLQYDLCTFDTPPPLGTPAWEAFVAAVRRYLFSRTVRVPLPNSEQTKALDARPPGGYKLLNAQPSCITGGTLFDFQLEGFNWLMSKWWSRQSCILADDMGVGKTIQIAALLGYMGHKYKAYPSLLVVPNSTLTNWVRELEKWVPHLCVVPYFGSADSRAVIRQYELYHSSSSAGRSPLKAHVVLTCYNVITSTDFSEFKKIGRWETVIVDEGQRLKSGTAKIVTRLTELKAQCRVVVTGTPLNNTVREILNLLHFLDPTEWDDLDALEARYAVPDEQTFGELRSRIAPYMLRRKNDVLNLKLKHEIIVPMSMRPLQKQIYKSLIEKDAGLMAELAKANLHDPNGNKKPPKIKRLKNLIMQLRKCLQHPYLNVQQLALTDASKENIQQSLIDGSAKLTFLRMLLPQLIARGHRVLLFSQFVIALDIIQEFCAGEGIETLRLDGNTPQAQRQGDIDRFNAPNSSVPLFMLSTRAGGVGVNLATADFVIIFDPDWNPHMDMQAIARAHRHGQQKNVLVMRLVMKDTIEEKMMEAAKRKLMLDHLIVQTSAEDNPEEDFAKIVLDGARALFEKADDDTENDIKWDNESISNLITELENREAAPVEKGGFTFAPIYDSRTHATANAANDDSGAASAAALAADVDYWEEIVRKATERDAQKQREQYGRGARARPDKVNYVGLDPDVASSPHRAGPHIEDDGEFNADAADSDDSDVPVAVGPELAQELAEIRPAAQQPGVTPAINSKGLSKRGRPKKQLPLSIQEIRGDPPAGPSAASGEAPVAVATNRAHAAPPPTAAGTAPAAAKPPKRRRISDAALASGIKQRPWDLAQYHLNRLYRYSTNIGPSEGDFLKVLFDWKRTPEERWAAYLTQAKKIDDLLALNGEERLFARTKTLREVQPLVKASREQWIDLAKIRAVQGSKPGGFRVASVARASQGSPTSGAGPSSSRHSLQSQSTAQARNQASNLPRIATNSISISSSSRSAPGSHVSNTNGGVAQPLQVQPRPQARASGVAVARPPAARPPAAARPSQQDACVICGGSGHPLNACPKLATVESIQQTIEFIRAGQDSEQDKAYAIGWLLERQRLVQQMQARNAVAPAGTSRTVS